jgi:hypothetical protein
MELVRQLPPIKIRAGGMVLPFNVYIFSDSGRPLLVFHSIIADRQRESHDAPMMETGSGNTSLGGRWASVASGMRNQGQRLLEAAVWGTDNVDEASAALQRFLEQAIESSAPSPKP